MQLDVWATCEDVYDAYARGYLYVAGHRTGRLPLLKLTDVQTSVTKYTINVPVEALRATRAYARHGRHHYRRMTLKFVVSATDRTTGLRYPRHYSVYSRLRI